MSYDEYEYVEKKCENCELWNTKYTAYIPTGYPGLFGPEVSSACLCMAGQDGPEVESDPLLSDVHSGLACVFTASYASCANWKPDETIREEVREMQEEYERELAWHHARGLYPGVNCPPL